MSDKAIPVQTPKQRPRFEIIRAGYNWDDSLVLGTFGPFLVVDHGRYDNPHDEAFHRTQAERFLATVTE